MHYLVYQITNVLNGRDYIGAHKTENKDDGYMGSGKILKRAIKKYGLENFRKEILFEASSSEEMFTKEKELVVLGPKSYNIKEGGHGGWDYNNFIQDSDHKRKIGKMSRGGEALAKKIKNDPVFAERMRLLCIEATKKNPNRLTGYEFVGKKHTEETKQKMSDSHKGSIPWNKGKSISPEVRAKISASMKAFRGKKKYVAVTEELGSCLQSSFM